MSQGMSLPAKSIFNKVLLTWRRSSRARPPVKPTLFHFKSEKMLVDDFAFK